MKLEQNELSLLFSTTNLPDVFFTEYLSQLSGDSVKIYLSRDTAIINNIIDRWYAPGYRYPVLEARATAKSKNVPLLTQALYFPPHDQQ